MEVVAQLVRASDCGSEGRGFEPHQSPQKLIIEKVLLEALFFITYRPDFSIFVSIV